MVAAVSGFVDGFFKGRDWRDGKEDRTLDRERQGRLDEINEGRYGLAQNADRRAEGNYGRQVEEYDYQVGERERQGALDEQERQAQASWAESMRLGATPPPQSEANPNFPVYGNETPAGAEPAAQTYTPAPARPDLSFGQLGVSQNSPTPQQDASRFKDAREQKNRPSALGLGRMTDAQIREMMDTGGMTLTQVYATLSDEDKVASIDQFDRLEQASRQGAAPRQASDPIYTPRPQNPNTTVGQTFPSSFGEQGRAPTQEAPAPTDQGPGFGERLRGYGSSALDAANRSAGVITDIGDYDRNRDFGESGGAPGDVGNLMQRGVSAISNAPGALARQTGELATNAASAVNRVVDPVLDYVAGVTANPNYGQTTAEDAETPPAEGDQSDEATNKLESAAAASEVPAVQADAEQGVAIARDVALSYGLRPGEDVTAAQTDRGSQAYVDRYYETVVPQAIEFYIGRGEMDKAQAYIELVESREGKAALRDIGRSTFSMMTGDVDAAAEHALSAFKQYGYVDPNMEVDLEATGLFNDADGNPGGARIVLLNKDTGERTEQTFATADEYLKYVHMMVSPATVAEMLFDNQPEQRGAITQQDVMKGASDIMSADLSGQTTMEQAIQQYMQGVQSLGTLSGGGGAQQEAPLFRLGNW